MKIELKNIKHSEFASHETNCYEATIYIDGQKVGTVENDGQGGTDNVQPWSVAQQIDAYAATLPKIVCSFEDPNTGKPAEMSQNHETIFGDILTDWLHAKDLKRAMAKRILFTKEDGMIHETITLKADQLQLHLKRNNLRDVLRATAILNLMPFDQALKTYKQGAAA
jgi:hypothetical protein